MLIVAPIAATLIQLAVSRSREYQADATGAHFTGNPYALASALQKLDAYSRRVPMQATPSTAHLFIIQPLLGMNFRKPVLYASSDRQAHRAPHGPARRVHAVRLLLAAGLQAPTSMQDAAHVVRSDFVDVLTPSVRCNMRELEARELEAEVP